MQVSLLSSTPIKLTEDITMYSSEIMPISSPLRTR